MAEIPEFVSDTEAAVPAEPADISPHVAEPAVETAPVEDAPAAQAVDENADMFPRSYVEDLRRENAKYRTRAQQYDQAFEGYDDQTREDLLKYVSLTQRAQAGDTQAAQELAQWLGDDDQPDEDLGYEQMTPEQYMELVRQEARQEAQRIVAEREQYQSQQAAVDGVRQTAEQMGYEFGSPDYMLLLKFANELDPEEHPDLLAAAHDQVEAYYQQIVEKRQGQYLAEKEAQTLAAPKVAGAGTSPDLSAGPPRSFAEARARFDERLQNQR